MADIAAHERVHRMILGPLERPALRWLAGKAPRWVTPDKLTTLGVLGSVVIFAGYCLTKISPWFLWLASFGFFMNWLGDSLDGTLARYREEERPKYGFFVDHAVDAVSEFLVFMGLGLSVYMQFEVAAAALIGYLLVSALSYIRTAVDGRFQISYGRIGPTELRVLVVLANAALFFFGNASFDVPLLGLLTVLDLAGIVIALGLIGTFFVSTARQVAELRAIGK